MVTPHGPRIERDWKISQVLDAYPELVETLAAFHPAFSKLRNPLLRKVQSRLVTVEQAAGVAGVRTESLLDTLNTAAGHEPVVGTASELAASQRDPAPAWIENVQIAESLDVRPILAAGEEPFGAITVAARRIPIGQVLAVRTTFEPVPLRPVLAKQGFDAYSTGSGDDWTTMFLRVREPGTSTPPKEVSAAIATAEVTIDVSELVPPEPMMKILAALEHLPAGGQLTVHHVRRPMHLYPQLDDLGYAHVTTEDAPDRIRIIISKPGGA